MEKKYNLHLNNFDGPIDLLLTLVKEKQMNILNINLVDLASEYVRIIDEIKEKDIDLAIEYLVMASTLLQIKARALLETPESIKFVKEAKTDILKKMIEYQQFKNISKVLREKELERKNIFIKTKSPDNDYQYEINESHLDGNLDAIKIIMALRKMFERTNAKKMREITIEKFNLSPVERRLELIALFKNKEKVSFEDIFSVSTINHFIVTIITVLDMARKQELKITQNEQFGNIKIEKGVINEI